MEIKTCFILTIFCFILAGESIKLTIFCSILTILYQIDKNESGMVILNDSLSVIQSGGMERICYICVVLMGICCSLER